MFLLSTRVSSPRRGIFSLFMIEGHAIAVALHRQKWISSVLWSEFARRSPTDWDGKRAMSIDWEHRRPAGRFLFFIREQRNWASRHQLWIMVGRAWIKGSRLFDRLTHMERFDSAEGKGAEYAA
ncbi:hypothetical protein V8C26DRAFT_113555 [Trichoderma gracile]